MKFTSNIQKNTKAGIILHEDIKSKGSYYSEQLKNVGAFICTKSEKPYIIIEGEYMRGKKGPVSFRRKFELGDTVEVDSYNMVYLGQIVKITSKTISCNWHGVIKRFDLFTFIYKNWDLDLDEIHERNLETSYAI